MFASSLLVIALGLSQTGPASVSLRDTEEWIAERDMAKARFEASRAPVKDLHKRRLAAIEGQRRIRFQEYQAGRCTLEVLMEVEAVQFQARKQPELLPAPDDAVELLWKARYAAFQLSRVRLDSARGSASDFYDSQQRLLETEMQLALRAAKSRK